jgi:ABC-2 type transport system permease protein
MFAEYKHTIGRLRSQAVGWSIGLIFYGLLLGSMYDTITAIEGIDALLKSYPQDILAFFGGMAEMTTSWGYLDVEYFTFMNLIIGIFAIGACVNLIVGDEEKGLLDLVLAHPISRSRLYWGRLLAFTTVIAVILLIAWLSLVIPSSAYGFDLTPIEFLRPFLSLFAISMIFSTFALFLSLILPSARLAGMLSGALMVLNFLLIGLSRINPDLEPFMKYTPMVYYQGGYAIKGLEWGWFFGLLIAASLFALLAWIPFLKRDIRVSGEHSWRLPTISLTLQVEEKIKLLKERICKIKPDKNDQKKTTWVVILLATLAFIVIFCVISLIIIDAANQWCNLFAGLFNTVVPGVCP